MSKTNFIESLISQDPSRSQCLQSVAEALWDAKYVCCNGHETSSQCLTCRQECTNVYELTGLSDALSVLKDIVSVD